MAAPAAPVIRAMQTGGGQVRVAWRAVDTATDYNVYFGEDPIPTGLEDEINDAEAEADGSFVWFSADSYAGFVYVRITALNSLAEESGYSNERGFYLNESNVQENHPTGALRHIQKGL